jgi:hypothetical protein
MQLDFMKDNANLSILIIHVAKSRSPGDARYLGRDRRCMRSPGHGGVMPAHWDARVEASRA